MNTILADFGDRVLEMTDDRERYLVRRKSDRFVTSAYEARDVNALQAIFAEQAMNDKIKAYKASKA